jgi:hypothetical protein
MENNKIKKSICGMKTEVYSRVVGYFRPVEQWNKGKQAEFKDRKIFDTGGLKNDINLLHFSQKKGVKHG